MQDAEFRPSLGSKEIIGKQTPCLFGKFGGTWDMILDASGKLVGSGNLDDRGLRDLELSLGAHLPSRLVSQTGFELADKTEKALSEAFYRRLLRTSPEKDSVEQHIASWCPEFGKYITGPFLAYYSGDSAHLRPSLSAPIATIIVGELLKNPQRVLLGAQGTDTADIAVLSIIDALTFDTQLPPVIFTGANRSYRDASSDAPKNFLDLARVAKIDLPPGAYWVFHGRLFSAADFVKLNPLETRTLEGQSTFFSPHRAPPDIETLLSFSRPIDLQSRKIQSNHMLQNLRMENMYEALNKIHTIDLGDQNPMRHVIEEIFSLTSEVIILEAHSLGNVNNVVRDACIEVAKRGKTIVCISRSLIGDVNSSYQASIIGMNTQLDIDLGDERKFEIIAGGRLNKTAVRALATRTLIESPKQVNQRLSQLIEQYQKTRKI